LVTFGLFFAGFRWVLLGFLAKPGRPYNRFWPVLVYFLLRFAAFCCIFTGQARAATSSAEIPQIESMLTNVSMWGTGPQMSTFDNILRSGP
jgi:hypothetical protein